MAVHDNRITTAKLANGVNVFVDDHVYVSPPWSERDGTPYIVARIIEFLQPLTTPKKSSRLGPSELSVRLSLYYRPSDISGRNVSDFRLLLAAIHTDVQPISNVRGKCYVRHRDRIDNLIKWKHLPDHFYFVKFFDPYIKREYEVLRTESVNNIPPHVREALLARYEFLVTEKEMVADLTDSFHACCVCEKWAASQESVKCESCKKHYHMSCLSPPLLAKPAKGYSWVCIPCSLQRHKDVQDQKFLFNSNGFAPRPNKSGTKMKDRPIVNAQRPDVSCRGWPWRYFGLYTRAQDTLDPDDPIFPRAATRVGAKFQATVLSWEEQQEAELHHGFGDSEAGPSRHIGVERGHDNGERKHESTIDVICTPSDELASYMVRAATLNLPVPAYDVERLDRSALAFTSLGGERALRAMGVLQLEDYHPVVFNSREITTFEAELEENGGLDTHKTAKVLGKRPAEVLRFSYIWKNKKLEAENEAIRLHQKVSTAHARQNKTLGAPSLGRIRARADSDASDDEVSFYNASFASTNKVQCAACSTKISNVWWKCPRTVQGTAMCESCGTNYRKYGVIQFVKADDTKRLDKKEPKKKNDTGSGTATPVPPPPKLPPCACCRRMEPKSTMARCKTCTFSAHAGCYGIAPEYMTSDWECELCVNARLEDNHLEPRCVLCPKDNSAVNVKTKPKKSPLEFDIFSAYKPTEGRRWAHVLCSTWMPEIVFTNPGIFKTVEGIATLPRERWEQTCSLCYQRDGAVIGCGECAIPFHAACAWLSGYRFGFEFSLAKPGKREAATIVKFKEEAGVMHAGCWCKVHDLEGRTIFDMHEIDPEQNETALQIFTASYKALRPDDSFALLRKATRLDHVIPPMVKTEEETPRSCFNCGVDVSPKWYKMIAGDDQMIIDGDDRDLLEKEYICHRCHHKASI